VQEGEVGDGDGYRAPNAQESICQGVLAFMMGSSRSFGSLNEAQLLRGTGNAPASAWSAGLDTSPNRLGRVGAFPSFLSLQ